MKRLNDDVTWTTNLGNAFLAQQNEVMDAVQRMRSAPSKRAGCNRHLSKCRDYESRGQPYIDIEPADPDVMYVPVYDPLWIWGPPLWYPYPGWYWPPRSFLRGGLYFGFGGGINVGLSLEADGTDGAAGLASRMGRSQNSCE